MPPSPSALPRSCSAARLAPHVVPASPLARSILAPGRGVSSRNHGAGDRSARCHPGVSGRRDSPAERLFRPPPGPRGLQPAITAGSPRPDSDGGSRWIPVRPLLPLRRDY